MNGDNAEVLAKLDSLTNLVVAEFRAVRAEQLRHTEAIAELRGELRGLSAWLSSMDRRLVAIIRPSEPPAE